MKFYQNLHLLLAGNDYFLGENCWDKVSHYNFIQNIMRFSEMRPTLDDFKNGATTFSRLLEVLKPDYCLFCGVTSYNVVFSNMQNVFGKNISNKQHPILNGAYPRTMEVKETNEKDINLIFIKHPSSFFNHRLWRKFIHDNFRPFLECFRDISSPDYKNFLLAETALQKNLVASFEMFPEVDQESYLIYLKHNQNIEILISFAGDKIELSFYDYVGDILQVEKNLAMVPALQMKRIDGNTFTVSDSNIEFILETANRIMKATNLLS